MPNTCTPCVNLFNVADVISFTWTLIDRSVAILLYPSAFCRVDASKSASNGCVRRARNAICAYVSRTVECSPAVIVVISALGIAGRMYGVKG